MCKHQADSQIIHGGQLVRHSPSLTVFCIKSKIYPFSILHWKPPEGLNPTQGLEFLQSKIETLGGKSLGTWTIDCETLQSTPSLSELVCGVSLDMYTVYERTDMGESIN